jgi:hypothetical protein
MIATTLVSDKETDDAYCYVVKQFDDRWRLIVGAIRGSDFDNATQWILQERRGRQWHGRKYFARAAHVASRVRQLVGEEAGRWAAEWASAPRLKHT